MNAMPSAATAEMQVEGLTLQGMDAFTAATTEEKLLHSYDRFYKVVSKTTSKDSHHDSPLPSLENFLQGAPSFSEERLEELRDVWTRAQRFTEVQRVVENFHQYRSDLVHKARSQSKAMQSESSVDMEDGLKEVLKSQCRMEQQLQFHSALLVGIEQHRDHFPEVVTQLIEKNNESKHDEERSALHHLLNQSQTQISKLEQMVMGMEARFLKWSGRESEWKLPATAWPETLHNNIVYSSSSFEGSNSSCLPCDELHKDGMKDSATTDGESSDNSHAAPSTKDRPGKNMKPWEQGTGNGERACGRHRQRQMLEQDDSLKLPPRPKADEEKLNDVFRESLAITSCGESGDGGDVGLPRNPILYINQQQQQAAALTASEFQANKSESHLVHGRRIDKSDKETKVMAVQQEEAHFYGSSRRVRLSEHFKEDFLQDVLRVQENIQSSNLGGSVASTSTSSNGSQSMREKGHVHAFEERCDGQSADGDMSAGLLGSDIVSLLN